MRHALRWLSVIGLICVPAVTVRAGAPKAKTLSAVVETTLKTSGGQIRQFAFDGDADSYFASAKNPGKDDHFTLVFDKAVAVRSIKVATGKPKGGDALNLGVLEVSADGKKFEKVAEFHMGVAHAKPDDLKIKAVRIRPSEDMKHPLAIREFTVVSEPKVATFKYPIEFTVDVSERAGNEGVGGEDRSRLRAQLHDDLR